MDKEFVKSIIKTLSFFDIFSYPLTEEEIYKFLYSEKEYTYLEFLEKLHNFAYKENSLIEMKNGFFYFKGKRFLIGERQIGYRNTEEKLKILKRGVKILRLSPFIKAIFSCNSVSFEVPKYESDIDVFIIVKKNRMWITRFFATFLLHIFGLRRHGEKIRNRICLSFFVTEDNLNLEKSKKTNIDIYLMYWIINLIPIYDEKNIRKKIIKENNFIKNKIKNTNDDYFLISRYKVEDSFISLFFKKIFELFFISKIGDFFEKIFKYFELKYMKINKREKLENASVIIEDKMLKFHENDRRIFYKNKWEDNIRNYERIFYKNIN